LQPHPAFLEFSSAPVLQLKIPFMKQEGLGMSKVEVKNIKNSVEIKEALISELIESEALINLLERKGIISKRELHDEIKKLRLELQKAHH
jgi:hypothetical protein